MPNIDWTNKNTLQNLINTIQARLIQKVAHYYTIPQANSNRLGEIIQFVGTTDNTYTNGYFYKCVAKENESTGAISYKWEPVSVQAVTGISSASDNALVELQDGYYVKAVQATTLPIANSSNVGAVYQYIGATTANYITGYFYKNTSTTNPDTGITTYSWTAITVQGESVKHWIGTRAELTSALENDEIEEGTIILITDEPDVDNLPTENSTNLVYSGGVWTALQGVASDVSITETRLKNDLISGNATTSYNVTITAGANYLENNESTNVGYSFQFNVWGTHTMTSLNGNGSILWTGARNVKTFSVVSAEGWLNDTFKYTFIPEYYLTSFVPTQIWHDGAYDTRSATQINGAIGFTIYFTDIDRNLANGESVTDSHGIVHSKDANGDLTITYPDGYFNVVINYQYYDNSGYIQGGD